MKANNIRISIPQPCHEDWNKMTINEKGRFCASCAKTVVDFTESTPQEIYHHIQTHPKTCGRVKLSNSSKTTKNYSYRDLSRFASALFLVFGMSLFIYSCKLESPIGELIVLTEEGKTIHDSLKESTEVLNDSLQNHSLSVENQGDSTKINTASRNEAFRPPVLDISLEYPSKISCTPNWPDELILSGNIIVTGDIIHYDPERYLPDYSNPKLRPFSPTIYSPYVSSSYTEDGKVEINVSSLPLLYFQKHVYTAQVEIYKNWVEIVTKKEVTLQLPMCKRQIDVDDLGPGDYKVVVSFGHKILHSSFTINNNENLTESEL